MDDKTVESMNIRTISIRSKKIISNIILILAYFTIFTFIPMGTYYAIQESELNIYEGLFFCILLTVMLITNERFFYDKNLFNKYRQTSIYLKNGTILPFQLSENYFIDHCKTCKKKTLHHKTKCQRHKDIIDMDVE